MQSCFFSDFRVAGCVEDESEFGRQDIASFTFLWKVVTLGTSILETERVLGTNRTGATLTGPLGSTD